MSEVERVNKLYWNMVHIIEPALFLHIPQAHEPIEERAARLRLETLAKGKAKAILGEMHELGFLSVRITPSSDAP